MNRMVGFGLAAAAVIIFAVIGVQVLLGLKVGGPTPVPPPSETPSASSPATPPPSGEADWPTGSITIGNHYASLGGLSFSFAIPDGASWTAPELGVLAPEDRGWVAFLFPEQEHARIMIDACEDEAGPLIGPTASDLINGLTSIGSTTALGPTDAIVGGQEALKAVVTIDDSCRGTPFLTASEDGGWLWYMNSPDSVATVWAFDLGGQRYAIESEQWDPADAEFAQLIEDLVGSIRFGQENSEFVAGMPGNTASPAGVYGTTVAPSDALPWTQGMHHVVEDGEGGFRQTQLTFAAAEDCFGGWEGSDPNPVTVAGLDALYVEPYGDPAVQFGTGRDDMTTGAYALPFGEAALCVYLSWDAQTTAEELEAARQVVESIRGRPFGNDGVQFNFILPAGWDKG